MTAKTPLVLLPGLNCTRRLFEAQIEALEDVALAVVPDLTGASSVADLAAGVLASAPERFALAGLSMGGYVAFEIMRRAPERVTHLALLDTQALPDSEEATAKRRRLIALAENGEFEKVLTVLAWTDLVARTRAADDSLEAVIYGMAEDVGPAAFVRQETAIIGRPDSRPGLARIDCPTLVLVGDDDRLTPPAAARLMADAIPGAELVIVADCGHLSALERPAEVSTAMRRWLAR